MRTTLNIRGNILEDIRELSASRSISVGKSERMRTITG